MASNYFFVDKKFIKKKTVHSNMISLIEFLRTFSELIIINKLVNFNEIMRLKLIFFLNFSKFSFFYFPTCYFTLFDKYYH